MDPATFQRIKRLVVGSYLLLNSVTLGMTVRRLVTGLKSVTASWSERLLVDLAVLLAGRRRAWLKNELLAGLAYSRHGDRPSTPRARLHHAADLIRGAAIMRARDIGVALAGPSRRLAWMARPAVPALLATLGLAVYHFMTGHGFAAITDHLQDLEAASGVVGVIEAVARQIRRRGG